jgi:hypothetical protein
MVSNRNFLGLGLRRGFLDGPPQTGVPLHLGVASRKSPLTCFLFTKLSGIQWLRQPPVLRQFYKGYRFSATHAATNSFLHENALAAAGIVFTERGVEFRKWPARPYVPTGIKSKQKK